MSSHNDWINGTDITPALYNDHLDHDGAVNDDDTYKNLAGTNHLKISGSNYYLRNGLTGVTTKYTAAATAIQAGLDLGGTLRLGEGSYSAYALNMSTPVNVIGESRDATIITIPDSALASGTLRAFNVYANDCLIANLTIDGNKANQAAFPGLATKCIGTTAAITNLRIRDVYVYDSNDVGIYVPSGSYVYLNHVELADAGNLNFQSGSSASFLFLTDVYAHGAVADNNLDILGSDNVWMTRCVTTGSLGNHGIGVYKASNIYHTDCYSYDNLHSGFYTDDEDVACDRVEYHNCRAYSNGYFGLDATKAGTGTISNIGVFGGFFWENDYDGIHYAGVVNGQIVGPTCYNNGQAAADTYSGLEVNNCTDIIVKALRAYDDQGSTTQRYGIEETGTSEYCIYKGNNLRGNSVAPIVLVGQTSVVDRHIVSVEMDLSAAAEDFPAFYAVAPCCIVGYHTTWTEAAGDANTCTIRVGEIEDDATTDDDQFDAYTTAGNETLGQTTFAATADMTDTIIDAAHFVTVGHTQKTGAGKVILTLLIAEMAA
jgi:hypothetical protein